MVVSINAIVSYPVWHGVAEKKINESDREDVHGTIRATTVDAVLGGFPPEWIVWIVREQTL